MIRSVTDLAAVVLGVAAALLAGFDASQLFALSYTLAPISLLLGGRALQRRRDSAG